MPDLKEILKKLAKEYTLNNPEIIDNLIAWGGTLRLKVFASYQEFFVKEKVPYLLNNEFKFKNWAHYQLASRGAPVIPILVTNDLVSYLQVENRFFEIMPWIKGIPVKAQSKDLFKLSSALAYFQLDCSKYLHHNILYARSFNRPILRQKLFPDQAIYISHYLEYLRCSRISDSFKPDVVSKIIERSNKFLDNIQWNMLMASWIHGDPGLDNAINYNGNILLFDLDNIRYGYRIWDLVRLCASVGSFKIFQGSIKEVHTEWDRTSIYDVISGFISIIPLNKGEYSNFIHLLGVQTVMNFISEFDLDDSYDITFKPFNISMNHELMKLLHLMETVNSIRVS